MEQELAVHLFSQVTELKAMVESQQSGWFTLGAAGLGGLFGFLASWYPTASQEKRRREHDANTLLASLVAEISAMAAIIRSRRYIDGLKWAASQASEGQMCSFPVNVPADYFLVYKSNTAKLGMLDAQVAARIVYLYHLVESVVQDVVPGGVLAGGVDHPEPILEDIEFLEKALEIADDLVAKYGAVPVAKKGERSH